MNFELWVLNLARPHPGPLPQERGKPPDDSRRCSIQALFQMLEMWKVWPRDASFRPVSVCICSVFWRAG
jgi:hypothetical protein